MLPPFFKFRVVVFPLLAAQGMTLAQHVEPPMPAVDGGAEIYSNTLLGPDPYRLLDYPRSDTYVGGIRHDYQVQSHLDTLTYDGPEPTFYQRNRNWFAPVDTLVGLLAPNDAWDFEDNTPEMFSLEADVRGFRPFVRPFSPETSTIKAGPLYLDVLWLGGGVVYSDFSGDRTFKEGDEDGWVGYMDIGVRSLLRITDNLYMSAVATFMYLPFENRVALRYGINGQPLFYTRMEYKKKLGNWDLYLYDQFRGNTGFGFNFDTNVPEIDRAGRYVFGFLGDRTDEFFDDRTVILSNIVGGRARRLVFDNQWHFQILADHTDFWRSFDFEEHNRRDRLVADLGYEGMDIPFAPRFRYQMISTDGFDSIRHQISLRLHGRLTENVRWTGIIGENFTSGVGADRSRFLWELGLEHTLTAYTRHWIRMGENFFYNEIAPQTLTGRFIRYGIEQRIDSRLSLLAFAQFADREVLNNEHARERMATGLSVLFRPFDYTRIRGTAMYENTDQRNGTEDTDRWLYRVEVMQALGYKLDATVFYQYEERQAQTNSFTEHVTGMSVRRNF